MYFVRVEHDLRISYQKAWRVPEPALDEIRSSSEESYKMAEKFAYMLHSNNPGILKIYITVYVIYLSSFMLIFFMFVGYIVEYQVDANGRFLYFFMTLSASIAGWQHCCPVISIDGTNMRNKYEYSFICFKSWCQWSNIITSFLCGGFWEWFLLDVVLQST